MKISPLLLVTALLPLVNAQTNVLTEDIKLNASGAGKKDRFGISVAVDFNGTMVIGAPWDEDTQRNSGVAYIFAESGGAWNEAYTLTAGGDAAKGDRFGYSVSVDDDIIVVGAPLNDDTPLDSGSAYIFSVGGGGWTQKLTGGTGLYGALPGDHFGWSVAVDTMPSKVADADWAGTIVIGAPFHAKSPAPEDSGAAYVFERAVPGGVWIFKKMLTAADAQIDDRFGWSVDVCGRTIVIGAHRDDHVNVAGDNQGSAYVFERNNAGLWSQQEKLTALNPAQGDRFGKSVAIDGIGNGVGVIRTIVVGAPFSDNPGNSGSAHVFSNENTVGGDWSAPIKLIASDKANGDRFGRSVSIQGNSIVVGAHHDDDNSGAAYVFGRAGGWSETAKLTASDKADSDGDRFGKSVSVSGDKIVVGSAWDDDEATDTGAAYYFSNPVPSATSGCFGDPHIVTLGGDMYDFHGQCDLVLLSAPHFANGMGLDINIRTKIVTGSWWSYIEAAAIRIGNDLLEVQGGFEDSWIWVNGEPNEKMELGKAVTTHVGAYSIRAVQKGEKQRVVRIRRDKKEILVIKSYNEIVRVDVHASADFEESRGLMGSFPRGQKVARDGTTIMDDDIEFGKHWQVQANEVNLFHSVDGTVQAPDACVMPIMKTTQRRLGEGMRRREAEVACENVHEKQWAIACVEDVLATGDKGVAEAYAEDDGAGAF